MKAIGVLNYPVEDVFHVFIKNAKRDFSDFNEEDATGCKMEKNIDTGRKIPAKVTIEITEYEVNGKYQLTTTSDYAKCISTYNFKGQKDGSTKIVFEEHQSTNKFFGYASLLFQRFLARRNFQAKYEHIIDGLGNELKIYTNNIERSKPKKKK